MKAERAKGRKLGHLHLRYLNPLPANLGDILKRYRKFLVPELNMGQLLWVLRAKYLVDAVGLNKIQGRAATKTSRRAGRPRVRDRRHSPRARCGSAPRNRPRGRCRICFA